MLGMIPAAWLIPQAAVEKPPSATCWCFALRLWGGLPNPRLRAHLFLSSFLSWCSANAAAHKPLSHEPPTQKLAGKPPKQGHTAVQYTSALTTDAGTLFMSVVWFPHFLPPAWLAIACMTCLLVRIARALQPTLQRHSVGTCRVADFMARGKDIAQHCYIFLLACYSGCMLRGQRQSRAHGSR